MSKILFLGFSLTVGAIAGIGGLFLEGDKLLNQDSYKTTSIDKQEESSPAIIDYSISEKDSFLELEGGPDSPKESEVLEKTLENQTSARSESASKEDISSSTESPEESWEKTCVFYTVKSSYYETAVLSDYNFVSSKIKNSNLLSKIEQACRTSKKVYISNPKNSGWTYRDVDQKINWKVG